MFVFETEAEADEKLVDAETALKTFSAMVGYTVADGKIYPKVNGVTDMTKQPLLKWATVKELVSGDYGFSDFRGIIPEAYWPVMEQLCGLCEYIVDDAEILPEE